MSSNHSSITHHTRGSSSGRQGTQGAAARSAHYDAILRQIGSILKASSIPLIVGHTKPALALQRDSGNGHGNWNGGGGGDGNHASSSHSPQLLHTLGQADKEPVVLTLASFAVTKLAYVRLTKKFRENYMSKTGIDVRFRLTFAGSGVQARAVIDGLPADVLALALPLDVERVSRAGLIRADWRSLFPNNSVVCETTVALVVRKGNPKNITGWQDLIRPGVEVVLANPKTAGVARWIFLALWGSQVKKGDAAAETYVRQVFDNVVVQPRDAREASDVFYKQRVGDVLLTYENEVILTNEVYGDKALPYVIPTENVRIECPIAVVDKVVEGRGPRVRQASDEFIEYLFTAEAQREFGKLGFRVNPKVSRAAAEAQVGLPPSKLWNVDKVFGSWDKAQAKFFDAGQILDKIQEAVGKRRVEQRRVAVAKKE
eukprot:CAMPEP_0202890210 /NCGR_PEP_ID=MMETSP1392-20130828/709_1 /ASSEMBLY_ACC=CAM_ASM_000868 /TAXON_ID=225041 /ORGANISM="Chlamydomonas chlamydogama, Strain SAG 11-48b" /LENGTH=428 /DNA_ID=CAMNT_0049573747 /DNA_START=132 /DNA_END=1418 /DNA_ORIENTATION=+